MRTIEVSTEVFARIWALRADREESEDAILRRVLAGTSDPKQTAASPDRSEATKPFYDRGPRTWSQPTWATDLAEVLLARGGKARLQQIYDDVEKLRRAAGRSLPKSIEATVRRTLENHSSDSHNYTGGADLFCMPEGKGAGVWALRRRS
jgi:hypothetical protein